MLSRRLSPILLMLVMGSASLHAETILHDETSCETLAGLASAVVEYKNRGEQWSSINARFRQAIEEARGNPQALISDSEDEALVMGVLEAVYSSQIILPHQATIVIYEYCMGKRNFPEVSFH